MRHAGKVIAIDGQIVVFELAHEAQSVELTGTVVLDDNSARGDPISKMGELEDRISSLVGDLSELKKYIKDISGDKHEIY